MSPLLLNYVVASIVSSFTIPAYSSVEKEEATTCGLSTGEPLTFWLGRWNVFADGRLDGTSFIEPVLKGCAVVEHWNDRSGYKGLSLFYFEPHVRTWKQVWVTEQATEPGGVKEKTLVETRPDYARFEGSVWSTREGERRDRTTLARSSTGEVSQIIEISTDEGKTWTKVYDAVYRRANASAVSRKQKEVAK